MDSIDLKKSAGFVGFYQDLPDPASTASIAATPINENRRVVRRDKVDLLEGTNGKSIV